MIEDAKKIISENKLCVLSTCYNDLPNTSLMQYICDESCSKIYMITLKESSKHKNIERNPRVSLLIDTRDKFPNEKGQIKALTIYGKANLIEDSEYHKNIIDKIIKKFTDLTLISENINCIVIEVIVEELLLLESVDKSTYINV